MRRVPHHHLHKAEVSSAASRSLIAVRPQGLQAAISNAPQLWVALRVSSPVARAPSIRRALDLQGLAAPVRPVGVPDSAHAPVLEHRVPAALAVRDLLVVLRLPARHRARSAHHRIAHAAVDNNIRKRRKAQ